MLIWTLLGGIFDIVMALDAYICVVEVNMDLNWRIF
jgi:hypothetical protein